MKLQIKTLNQKSLIVDIEETKTVYELKKELSLYADVGVQPEQQKLIYSGKILNNSEPLSTYNIDVKKYLVIMILKQATEELNDIKDREQLPDTVKSKQTSLKNSTTNKESVEALQKLDDAVALPHDISKGDDIDMVQRIVSMGYPEQEVRNALKASFNNPDRAIEYLIEGLPTNITAATTTTTTASINRVNDNFPDSGVESMTNDTSVLDMFRHSQEFATIRRAILNNSELLDAGIQQVAETNPAFLELIDEHQQEFLSALIGNFERDTELDDENLDDKQEDDASS